MEKKFVVYLIIFIGVLISLGSIFWAATDLLLPQIPRLIKLPPIIALCAGISLIFTPPILFFAALIPIVDYIERKLGGTDNASNHPSPSLPVTDVSLISERSDKTEDQALAPVRTITGRIDRWLTNIPISGRDDDLTEIKKLLKIGPTAILGVGGLGKSRLAAEIVLTSPDIDGAIWHTASDISRPDEVLELLREHFGLAAATDRPDILKKLHGARCLIVLDNAEDVKLDEPRHVEYVQLVNDCLNAGARVLLTSRVEWPELALYQAHIPQTLTAEAAEKIVLDMAALWGIKADLKPQAAEIAKQARFHPRLIEWAVGLMRHFPVNKVITDLAELTSPSAQAALDEMILKTLRQMTDTHGEAPVVLLKCLNVCRGGFTYEAAAALNPDSVDLDTALQTLQTYLFVRFDRTRYSIDSLVVAAVGEDESAHNPHYDFYLALAQHHDEKQDYVGLDPDSANLEVAFNQAMATDNVRALYIANVCLHYLGNRGRFNLSLNWFNRLIYVLENNPNPLLLASAYNSLGTIYQENPIGDLRRRLLQAIEVYKKALVFRTASNSPMEYATTQNNLGNAYLRLAGIENRLINLQNALKAYRQALRFHTVQHAPSKYGLLQNNLGNTYRDLATIENRLINLQNALEAYRQALRYTPSVKRLMYGAIYNNLGNTYRDLGLLENSLENIRNAMEAFERALEFRTSQTFPLGYAETLNNLGASYGDLANLENRLQNLNKAIKAYEQALEFRTLQAFPLGYAETLNNLGITYRRLADEENPLTNLEKSLDCLEKVLLVYKPDSTPIHYAGTKNAQGFAYWNLAKLKDRASNLQNSIKAYEQALEFRTPRDLPLEYAQTQCNRGFAYKDLDNLSQAISCWREAEIYFRQMEAVDDADKMLEWISEAETKLKNEG